MRHFLAFFLLFSFIQLRAIEPLALTWPTPNTGWSEGKSIDAYLQHAGSGDPQSGAFGGVRSGGGQFHEGIDIKCVSRNRRGEPLDEVFAALNGIVRHVNATAGDSSYGRYVVLEHPEQTPAVFTLYAHLSKIAPGIRVGAPVTRGQVLGIVGHSSDKPIPRERAHLHFEIGLMITRNFQRWYDRQKFGSRNEQSVWNGMNLMGIDPLFVFNGWRDGQFKTMQDAFARLEPVVRIRLATHQVPDFITRYPSLLTKPMPMGPPAGWEIAFNWTGLPYAWTPLTSAEALGLPAGKPQIVSVDAALEKRERSKTLVIARRGAWVIGRDLDRVLEQLFALP